MVILNIPKYLLIHSIIYQEKIDDDGWGREEYGPEIVIDNVRVELNAKRVKSTNSEGEEFAHKIFVDRINSSQFPDFKLGSKIIFNGHDYKIVDVKILYALKPVIPHHYELVVK